MDVSISGDSIRLGQFLKLANLVESGGHAKEAIAAGDVAVNGEVVTSRSHLLYDADVVSLDSTTATVVCGGEEDLLRRTHRQRRLRPGEVAQPPLTRTCKGALHARFQRGTRYAVLAGPAHA